MTEAVGTHAERERGRFENVLLLSLKMEGHRPREHAEAENTRN